MAATRNRSNNRDATVELEALRREDSSWHPCRVSLSSSGVELIVNYGNTDSEDILVSGEEAIARLRIRSIPLDGDDCIHVKEGDHILATQKSQSKSFFFDAEVEKVLRVRHSRRVQCKCTFVIRWLHQDLKGGTLTVTSSSVMKLAAKSINEHPIVSTFLSMMGKRMGCSNCSPIPAVTTDLQFEINLHELLEKQRMIIISLVDEPKKRVSDDIVLCVDSVEVDAASKLHNSHVQDPPDHNHSKKTTARRSRHLQLEAEVEDPSIQEELSENRSPLNPLAACAAFALFMSKMPQIATSIPFELETHKDGNSTVSASGNTQLMVMGASSIRLADEKGTGTSTSQLPESRAGIECSLPKTNISNPPKVTRLTRSALKKGAGILDGSCVEQRLQPSTSPRRFTRSAFCKAKEPKTLESKHKMEEQKSGKQSVADCSGLLGESALENEKLATSQKDSVVELLSNQDLITLTQKQERNKLHEVERNLVRNSNGRGRVTRSAVHVENGINSRKETQVIEADLLAQNIISNSLEGNVTAARSSILEATDWSSSPLEAVGDSPHFEENPNGEKMSSVVKATDKNEGKLTGNGESRSLKRKGSPSKKEVRRSPRLQFLPRTRSQNKS